MLRFIPECPEILASNINVTRADAFCTCGDFAICSDGSGQDSVFEIDLMADNYPTLHHVTSLQILNAVGLKLDVLFLSPDGQWLSINQTTENSGALDITLKRINNTKSIQFKVNSATTACSTVKIHACPAAGQLQTFHFDYIQIKMISL